MELKGLHSAVTSAESHYNYYGGASKKVRFQYAVRCLIYGHKVMWVTAGRKWVFALHRDAGPRLSYLIRRMSRGTGGYIKANFKFKCKGSRIFLPSRPVHLCSFIIQPRSSIHYHQSSQLLNLSPPGTFSLSSVKLLPKGHKYKGFPAWGFCSRRFLSRFFSHLSFY